MSGTWNTWKLDMMMSGGKLMTKDWRADIRDIASLDDVDPGEMMIYLRHQFLTSAKDLLKSHHKDDREMGNYCSEVAERLQDTIDFFLPGSA